MKTITLDMLYALNACEDQRDLFAATCGQEAVVTSNACVEVAPLFNWGWAARHLLPAPLLAEYERQVAPLLAEYDRQRAPLWAEYERQVTPLWAEFDRQEAPLWAEFDRQVAPLLAEYDRQVARLFATLYNLA